MRGIVFEGSVCERRAGILGGLSAAIPAGGDFRFEAAGDRKIFRPRRRGDALRSRSGRRGSGGRGGGPAAATVCLIGGAASFGRCFSISFPPLPRPVRARGGLFHLLENQ